MKREKKDHGGDGNGAQKRKASRRMKQGEETQGNKPVTVPEELERMFPVRGAEALLEPKPEALQRYRNVAGWHMTSSASPLAGMMQSDSWSDCSPGELRSHGMGSTRRLQFEAGTVRLEIVAERCPEGWRFVARVYRQDRVTSDFVVRAGRHRALPQALGFYHWSASKGPGKITLESASSRISFEGITWV